MNPTLIFFMFLSLLVPALLSIFTPILIANAITAITVYDYDEAIYQTCLEFAVLIISTISYLVYHFLSAKINRTITYNFNNYIYENISNNKIKKNITLSTIKDIDECLVFNKNLIYKLCFFVKSAIILIIIFRYSKILSLILIAVSLVSYLILKVTDSKIQEKNKKLSTLQLESMKFFNSIKSGESAESNYNLESALKEKYFNFVSENVKTNNSILFFYNINNNFVTLILKIAVFSATIFLIGQVKLTAITLSVYLILTPYLTSSAENLISFFDIFSDIGIMDNKLKEFESLQFASNKKTEAPITLNSYNLYFYNVAVDNGENKLTLQIKQNESVLFVDENLDSAEKLYKILTKQSNNYSGGIFLDEKNISLFSVTDYNKIAAGVSPQEKFFNVSIFENLFMVCPNRKKIFQAVKQLGLDFFTDGLPQKLNTIVDDKINQKFLFFLGIARAYLSGVKIIFILDYPQNLSKQEQTILLNMLSKIKHTCSELAFFANKKFVSSFDKTIFLEQNNKT